MSVIIRSVVEGRDSSRSPSTWRWSSFFVSIWGTKVEALDHCEVLAGVLILGQIQDINKSYEGITLILIGLIAIFGNLLVASSDNKFLGQAHGLLVVNLGLRGSDKLVVLTRHPMFIAAVLEDL